MSEKTPITSPERKETLDDNARKFIVSSMRPELLEDNKATSFMLTTDWLETNEDDEKKLAYKEFENGEIQILLISKNTKDGNRATVKEKISEEKYRKLLVSSVLRLKKKRYEFSYSQNDTSFDIKYDEFADSKLRVLEVDAKSEEERNSFASEDFPTQLTEITGNQQYYGYRVASVI